MYLATIPDSKETNTAVQAGTSGVIWSLESFRSSLVRCWDAVFMPWRGREGWVRGFPYRFGGFPQQQGLSLLRASEQSGTP